MDNLDEEMIRLKSQANSGKETDRKGDLMGL